MQKDMHYYGTYAMAVAAGIPANDAAVIAYAAQFVDDSTNSDRGENPDGGFLWSVTTAHHPPQVAAHAVLGKLEYQRKMWIPFHFFPGGAGETLHEKLLCLKDGPIVRAMLENHLEIAENKPYCLELIGISAHVYADTFSHYGFSGMHSDYNTIVERSFTFVEEPNQTIKSYIMGKWEKFFASKAYVLALGHGSVATMPDRPYLNWQFDFKQKRPKNGATSPRNNLATYFEACEKLHGFFARFAKMRYANNTQTSFNDIKETVHELLDFEGQENERISKWQKSGLTPGIPNYDPSTWENGKDTFARLANSQTSIDTHIYRFHQAAAYHRYYVLKDLLPAHGIAAY